MLARDEGFEPSTRGFGGRRSTTELISYNGATHRDRTGHPLLTKEDSHLCELQWRGPCHAHNLHAYRTGAQRPPSEILNGASCMESNLQPPQYKRGALPLELTRHSIGGGGILTHTYRPLNAKGPTSNWWTYGESDPMTAILQGSPVTPLPGPLFGSGSWIRTKATGVKARGPTAKRTLISLLQSKTEDFPHSLWPEPNPDCP